jgi:2-iminoacetate synthase
VAQFSEFFKAAQAQIESLSVMAEPLRPLGAIFEAVEQGGCLTTEDAASLFAWGNDPSCRAEIHAEAERVRDRLAPPPRRVEFIIPVYLTSFCQNECLYCGYRQSNPLAERIRLSLEEFEKELDLILSWGHRQIELVLSDDPEFGPVELARYVELTRLKLDALGGGVIALCSPVYEQKDYARLAAAGLDWIAEWQETYHRPHFERWHFPGSPKRQFEFRLDIWDRAIAAGITKVGLGALLGLYEWRYDALAVIAHGHYLRRTYGIELHTLGIPRLKSARGVLASQKPSRFTVSDEDYRLIISVYHLAFPRSRLFFNTRESYEFNLSMVAGGDLFTVDCETLPGGYLRRRPPGQFSTHYYPPRGEVVAALARRGFSCRYRAEETESPRIESRECGTEPTKADLKRWAEEHAEIRSHLNDWQVLLSGLASRRGTGQAEPQAGPAGLREVLDFFKTSVIAHCRNEETVLFQAPRLRGQHAAGAPQLEKFRREHERLGVDLDRFERQLVSYGLSGDPSVLLTLGDRIIRELRQHLDAEEQFSTQWLGAGHLSIADCRLPIVD